MAAPPAGWKEADFREALTPYCFGSLDGAERDALEQHLFACDACWDELQRLEIAVRTLRSGPQWPSTDIALETVGAAKLASESERPFGGHLPFVLFAAVVHAALYATSVWTELVYAFERFASLLLWLTPVVFTFVCLATMGILWVTSEFARRGRRSGFEASLAGLGCMVLVLLVGLALVLPHEPTVQATITTRTGFVGYLKNVFIHFVPVALAFVLLPFQAVIGLEREVGEGRFGNVAALMSGDKTAFQPRGLWFVRPRTLGWLLTLAAVVTIGSTNYLLDRLLPGPYAGWFAFALYVRVGLWFLLAGVGLAWYSRRLQDLNQLTLLMKELRGAS